MAIDPARPHEQKNAGGKVRPLLAQASAPWDMTGSIGGSQACLVSRFARPELEQTARDVEHILLVYAHWGLLMRRLRGKLASSAHVVEQHEIPEMICDLKRACIIATYGT